MKNLFIFITVALYCSLGIADIYSYVGTIGSDPVEVYLQDSYLDGILEGVYIDKKGGDPIYLIGDRSQEVLTFVEKVTSIGGEQAPTGSNEIKAKWTFSNFSSFNKNLKGEYFYKDKKVEINLTQQEFLRGGVEVVNPKYIEVLQYAFSKNAYFKVGFLKKPNENTIFIDKVIKYAFGTNEVLQIIKPKEEIGLPTYVDIFGEIHFGVFNQIQLGDYNFDGEVDLRTFFRPLDESKYVSSFYLTSGQSALVYHSELSKLLNPAFDKKTKKIKEYILYADGRYVDIDLYEFSKRKGNNLVVLSEIRVIRDLESPQIFNYYKKTLYKEESLDFDTSYYYNSYEDPTEVPLTKNAYEQKIKNLK